MVLKAEMDRIWEEHQRQDSLFSAVKRPMAQCLDVTSRLVSFTFLLVPALLKAWY
jgi:hypothetical protein